MVALIPARGGSKGLPNKNIKKLCGKELIAYSIEEALNSKYVSEVYVSTDCQKIKEVAENYGAIVPFLRPDYLASDTSIAIDTYKHFIDFYTTVKEESIGNLIVLLPTSPLRKTINIDQAVELFLNKDADSVVSCCKEHHPVSWHKFLDNENRVINFRTELRNRQDEEVSYYPNGSIFIFRTDILKLNSYYTEKSYAYIMERRNSVDIDTIEDFEYAEFLIKKHGF
jgi:N-acylneuraminate cytidylyltransferase/CMP-N,N'-diacetyllegionaminic acid synthase